MNSCQVKGACRKLFMSQEQETKAPHTGKRHQARWLTIIKGWSTVVYRAGSAGLFICSCWQWCNSPQWIYAYYIPQCLVWGSITPTFWTTCTSYITYFRVISPGAMGIFERKYLHCTTGFLVIPGSQVVHWGCTSVIDKYSFLAPLTSTTCPLIHQCEHSNTCQAALCWRSDEYWLLLRVHTKLIS